jgi:IclR family transcriptional regulator, KDG regulon repressor
MDAVARLKRPGRPRTASRNGAAGVESQSPESRSVRRTLDIFALMLAEREPLSVTAIIERLRIPKSTAYELVRMLGESGYLERGRRPGTYFLGRRLFELGMAYRSQVDLLKEGSHVVESLRDCTGETVQLSVLENEMMLVLLKEESGQPIRIISHVGTRVPVNWAAAGRLLVSDLPDTELRRLLEHSARPSPTGRAPTDVNALVAQIHRVRAQGYAVELNEANAHAGCVAAPVLDATGRCVAAISIVAPEQRLQRKQRETLIAAVKEHAGRLSHRLGAP